MFTSQRTHETVDIQRYKRCGKWESSKETRYNVVLPNRIYTCIGRALNPGPPRESLRGKRKAITRPLC
jgi:hypothetical protein